MIKSLLHTGRIRKLHARRVPCRDHNLLRLPLITLIAIVFLSFVLNSGGARAGTWKGKEVKKDGVLHVMNPSEPIESSVTSQLKELWRVGGDSEEEGELFGLISRIMTDKDGNIYLLDTQLSEVKVFSPDGEYIRTMGREGEGPGEFTTPTGMFFTPGGNVGVLQAAPGRIVLLTPEGEPAGEYPLPKTEEGGFLILRNGEFRGENLVLSISKNSFTEGKFSQIQYLSSIDKDGKELAHYHEESASIDFANPVMKDSDWNNFTNRWILTWDGKVCSNIDYNKYTINMWNKDGDLDRIIECEYEPLKRSPEEMDRLNEMMKIYARRVPNGKVEINKYTSCVEQIYTREDGSIWVLSSRGSREKPEGAMAFFDVFDPRGRYVRRVTLMGEGDPLNDGFYLVGDRFYVVTGLLQASLALQAGGQTVDIGDEEPKPMGVICYSLDSSLSLTKR